MADRVLLRMVKGQGMPEEQFALYDSADYLKTEEAIAIFLEAAMEDGGDDLAYVAHIMEVVARARSRMSGEAALHQPETPEDFS